jgi:hypothetical protein
MAITNELQELRAQLAGLTEKVSTLKSELLVERQVGAITRKKTANCRVCQRPPETEEGHPPVTELELLFCKQGHRFKTLSPDQARTDRMW